MRLSALLRRTAAVLATLLCGAALAQGWSVQTVALRDLRQANAVAGELKALGFDAYTEFAMHDGEQFVRVRVGCYASRSAALAAADALAGHVTEQAVVVTLAGQSKADGCVQEDIGFIKPSVWQRLDAGDGPPSFSVQVAGHRATLVYTGTAWRVIQAGSQDTAPAAAPGASFVPASRGGMPWAAEQAAAGTRMLCPGTLLGKAGSAAVVERADEVVACRLVPLTPELADGTAP